MLSIAFRILGSQADAEDVVQETWIRFDRADRRSVRNTPAWLTTVASRLCVDLLRRRRDVLQEAPELAGGSCESTNDPEQTALLASELTTAFTIVLGELTPPQRVALVLHDAFAVPFDEVARILDTTPTSAKKLASRARERVRRRVVISPEDNAIARQVVQEFLRAVQDGNTDRLVALLDPNVIRLADAHVLPTGAPANIQGVSAVIEETLRFRAIASRAYVFYIDGAPGIVIFTGADVQLAIVLSIAEKRIVQFEVIADPRRISLLSVTPQGG